MRLAKIVRFMTFLNLEKKCLFAKGQKKEKRREIEKPRRIKKMAPSVLDPNLKMDK